MGVVRRSTAVLDDEEDREEPTTATTANAPDPDEIDDGLDPEDEDETTGRSSAVLTGAAGARTIKKMGSEFANEFKFQPKQKHLVRFLEDEQFASYRQHWVERKGKKSFICIGKGCPLCAAGDRASGKYAFNVWSYDDHDVRALIVGPVLLEAIENEVAASTRENPLLESYWALSRSGKGNKTSYGVKEIKERDLEEDFGITPAAAQSERADAKLYKASIFKVPSVAELTKVAREFTEDDVDTDDDD